MIAICSLEALGLGAPIMPRPNQDRSLLPVALSPGPESGSYQLNVRPLVAAICCGLGAAYHEVPVREVRCRGGFFSFQTACPRPLPFFECFYPLPHVGAGLS